MHVGIIVSQFELIKSEICTNCIKRLDFKEK